MLFYTEFIFLHYIFLPTTSRSRPLKNSNRKNKQLLPKMHWDLVHHLVLVMKSGGIYSPRLWEQWKKSAGAKITSRRGTVRCVWSSCLTNLKGDLKWPPFEDLYPGSRESVPKLSVNRKSTHYTSLRAPLPKSTSLSLRIDHSTSVKIRE